MNSWVLFWRAVRWFGPSPVLVNRLGSEREQSSNKELRAEINAKLHMLGCKTDPWIETPRPLTIKFVNWMPLPGLKEKDFALKG